MRSSCAQYLMRLIEQSLSWSRQCMLRQSLLPLDSLYHRFLHRLVRWCSLVLWYVILYYRKNDAYTLASTQARVLRCVQGCARSARLQCDAAGCMAFAWGIIPSRFTHREFALNFVRRPGAWFSHKTVKAGHI